MPLSDKLSKRVFRKVKERLAKGIPLDGKPIYLPIGNYSIKIALPQCLDLRFHKLGKTIKSILIEGKTISISLSRGRSCSCTGGRREVATKFGRDCVCPKSFPIWNEEKRRCVKKIAEPNRGWFERNWPWLLATGVGVGVAAAVIPLSVIAIKNQPISVKIKGKLFSKKP